MGLDVRVVHACVPFFFFSCLALTITLFFNSRFRESESCGFAAPSLQLCMRVRPLLPRPWCCVQSAPQDVFIGCTVYAEQLDADLLRDPSAGHPPALPPPRDTLLALHTDPTRVALTFEKMRMLIAVRPESETCGQYK